MKSEALQYLESRLAIGHINIQEFSVLHELLALFNRLLKLVKRTHSGEIQWRCGSKLIVEESSDARKHLQSFHRLYSHTFVECRNVATYRHVFDPSSSSDRQEAEAIRAEFQDDIDRLPGTKGLFDLISANFDDNIYHPFLETQRRNPAHQIWELESELTATSLAIAELYNLVCDANDWAGQIDRKLADFRRTCDEHGEGLALRHRDANSLPLVREERGSMICKTDFFDTPIHPYGVGRSFSAIEEAVTRRRASTKGANINHDEQESAAVRRSTSRGIGHVVPRVFTGSFSELEESVRNLRIPKPEGSPQLFQTTVPGSNGATRLVTTPVSSTTPMSSNRLTPSPGQLRRREALIEHDVEFRDRLIHGDVIRSRRPVDCDSRIEEPIPKNDTLTYSSDDLPSG